VLFTDYGLSGIPVLQLSRLAGRCLSDQPALPLKIQLDLLPEWDEAAIEAQIAQRASRIPTLPLADLLTGLVHRKIGQFVIREALHSGLDALARSLSPRQVKSLARSDRNEGLCPGPGDCRRPRLPRFCSRPPGIEAETGPVCCRGAAGY